MNFIIDKDAKRSNSYDHVEIMKVPKKPQRKLNAAFESYDFLDDEKSERGKVAMGTSEREFCRSDQVNFSLKIQIFVY